MSWPLVPLGELCEVLDSQRKPITKKDRVAGEVPYYGASGVVDWVANHIFEEPLVLLGEDGAKWGAGDDSAFLIEGKSWVNNHAHVLRPDRNRILDGWLVSYLVAADLSDFITGLTVPKLNQGRMKEIPVPLPPLEDQARIVALLEEATDAVSALESVYTQTASKLTDLRSSALASAMTGQEWPLYRFEDVIHVYQPESLSRKEMDMDGAHAVFGANGAIGMHSQFNHEDPELVLGCRGSCGSVNWSEPFSWITSNAMVVRPKNDILRRDFIFYLLLGAIDLNAAITGAAQPQITRRSLSELLVPVPSLEDQARIVALLDEVSAAADEALELASTRLETAKALRQSILESAFRGEL